MSPLLAGMLTKPQDQQQISQSPPSKKLMSEKDVQYRSQEINAMETATGSTTITTRCLINYSSQPPENPHNDFCHQQNSQSNSPRSLRLSPEHHEVIPMPSEPTILQPNFPIVQGPNLADVPGHLNAKQVSVLQYMCVLMYAQ